MREQTQSAERLSEPQVNGLTDLLAAFVDRGPMADLDDHNDKLVFADFIDNSVDSLSNPIPFLGRELYATLSPRIIAQCLDPLQNSGDIFFGGTPEIFRDGFFEYELITCHAI